MKGVANLTGGLLLGGMSAAGVIATGVGLDSTTALAKAKTSALEQAAGLFVIGTTVVQQGRAESTTRQYTAGAIAAHRVLSEHRRSDGLVEVTIDAEVLSGKHNHVGSSELDATFRQRVTAAAAQVRQQRTFAPALGEQPLFDVSGRGVQARAYSTFVELKVTVQVKWSRKFLSDVETYAAVAGKLLRSTSGPATSALCIGDRLGNDVDQGSCWRLHASIPSLGEMYLLRAMVTFKGMDKPLVLETGLDTGPLVSVSHRGTAVFRYGSTEGMVAFHLTPEQAQCIEDVSLEVVPLRSAKLSRTQL